MNKTKTRSGAWLLLVGSCLLASLSAGVGGQAPQARGVTVFEGARLIVGDGSAPVENSSFVVENDRLTQVGRRGDVKAPQGATRVDLTGRTVMPAIVDTHTHLSSVR